MKAIIVDTNTDAIDGEWRRELIDWAQGLGVDTDRATGEFALIENERGWRACFSIKRQRDNHDFVDVNTGRIAVDYGSVRFDVPGGSWPRWFPSPIVLPDMQAGHLLDALAAAREAATELKSNAWLKANPREARA